MTEEKFFTLEEARALLPELRAVLRDANAELDQFSERVQVLNRNYVTAEQLLDACHAPEAVSPGAGASGLSPIDNRGSLANSLDKAAERPSNDGSDMLEFRKLRANFELAIEELSREQSEFLRRLEFWVDKIDDYGVILRKLKEGLLDFPARSGDFKYYLCWGVDEDDITHWHLLSDGYIGRRALVSLSEYY